MEEIIKINNKVNDFFTRESIIEGLRKVHTDFDNMNYREACGLILKEQSRRLNLSIDEVYEEVKSSN